MIVLGGLILNICLVRACSGFFLLSSIALHHCEPSFHLLDRKQRSRISFSWIKGAKHVIELIAS